MSKKAKKMTGYIIGIGILTAMIVFFSYYKVDSVEVRGTSHYTDEEVKAMVLRGPLASNSVLAPMLYSTTNTDDVAFVDAFKVTVIFILTEMEFLWKVQRQGMNLFRTLTESR